MSRHRHRPPTRGIARRTRCNVVDNSEQGRLALMSGRPAYCFHVYKHGFRRDHMPKAQLGDMMLVACGGEVFKAICVGHNYHRTDMKHGVPSFDTNNIVLFSRTGELIGNRILAPIPHSLRAKGDNPLFAKLLATATKFV